MRECARPGCNNRIPPLAHGKRRYCCKKCMRAAQRERVREYNRTYGPLTKKKMPAPLQYKREAVKVVYSREQLQGLTPGQFTSIVNDVLAGKKTLVGQGRLREEDPTLVAHRYDHRVRRPYGRMDR